MSIRMPREITSQQPLVSILITTKDRPHDLRRTLQELRLQVYPAIELIVIDDGSSTPLQPIMNQEWPEGLFIRHSESAGCVKRRSESFKIAHGDYILELDDDSNPVDPGAISMAVRAMQNNPAWACLSFYVFNGATLPETLHALDSKHHVSFVGCGALFRSSALRQVGGYCDFFQGEREEEELSLRLLAAGWVVYFFPAVMIHHRVSVLNRNQERSWSRQIRNKLWTIVMHMPAARLPLELAWVAGAGFLDAVRMLRFKAYGQAMAQFLGGLPKVVRLRSPMPAIALRRYDAMRFGQITTEEDYQSPPKHDSRAVWRWFTHLWMNRARERSIWDRRPGDIGKSPTVGFAHEYETKTASGRKL